MIDFVYVETIMNIIFFDFIANVTLINETTQPTPQQTIVHSPHPTPPSTPLQNVQQAKTPDIITVSKSTTLNPVNMSDKQATVIIDSLQKY